MLVGFFVTVRCGRSSRGGASTTISVGVTDTMALAGKGTPPNRTICKRKGARLHGAYSGRYKDEKVGVACGGGGVDGRRRR